MRDVAIIAGSAAIAHAGWTTQYQMMPDILFPGACPAELKGARPHARDPQHFDILAGWLSAEPSADWGLPVLDPVMAIADAWLDQTRATHIYDPDDLDFDEIGPEGLQRLPEALRALGASPDQLATCLAHYHPAGPSGRSGTFALK